MSENTEVESNSFDVVKWIVVIALLVGLVVGYQAYEEISILYRALAAVAIVVISLGIASTTAKGNAFLVFAKDSRTEVRKVIWPERSEANRMTLIILVATAIVGLMLYLIDMVIVWGIGFLTGIGVA
jgi:preprotein translocase subunit SecE